MTVAWPSVTPVNPCARATSSVAGSTSALAMSCTEAWGVANDSRSVGRHGANRNVGALTGTVSSNTGCPVQPAPVCISVATYTPGGSPVSNRTTVGAGVCADATGAATRPASARATIHFMFATRTHLLTSRASALPVRPTGAGLPARARDGVYWAKGTTSCRHVAPGAGVAPVSR